MSRQGLGQVKPGRARGPSLAAACLALAGCNAGAPPQAHVNAGGAYIVLPTIPGRPATLYFVLDAIAPDIARRGPRRLMGVTVEGAARAEMHSSMTMDGMASMRPLAFVPLPNGVTGFCPGGNHVMLFGLDGRIVHGATTRVHLRLDGGTHLDPDAMVVSVGEAVAAEAPFGCPQPG